MPCELMSKRIMKCALSVLMVTTMSHVQMAKATEYLGFDLGKETMVQATAQLKAENAQFNDTYGFKGSSDLRSIRILSLGRFSKLGTLIDGWLSFTPRNVLYEIKATYSDTDAGDTFKALKDALDSKYGKPRVVEKALAHAYLYRNGKVEIDLERNDFGIMGSSRFVTIIYDYGPLLGEVKKMKAKIERKIRQENAKKLGSDL